jgi:hypothetical protein
MKKNTTEYSMQRAGGRCEPAGVSIFPLLELWYALKACTLYRTFERPVRFTGNLGGNADLFRPMV